MAIERQPANLPDFAQAQKSFIQGNRLEHQRPKNAFCRALMFFVASRNSNFSALIRFDAVHPSNELTAVIPFQRRGMHQKKRLRRKTQAFSKSENDSASYL